MKILHIGQMIGGLDVYIRNSIVYANIDAEYVIVHGDKDEAKPVIKDGKPVKEYEISLYRELNPRNDLKALLSAIRIIRKERPDVIHCHSAKGGVVGRIAGWICGVKTFYTPHAFSFLSTPSLNKQMAYKCIERACRLKSNVLACSESEAELAKDVIGYKPERVYTWHNAVPAVAYNHNVVDADHPYITYIGRPSYQKNPLFLVDVIRGVHEKHPEVKFYLLGVGYYSPLMDEMQAKIKEYHLENNIVLKPWLSHDDTLELVSRSLFYLTVSRYEGLPLAVIEAMSLGKAVVASDVVGNKDCVRDKYNGRLIPLTDKAAFVGAVNELIEDEGLRNEYAIHSRKYFEDEFVIEKRIHMLEDIYKGA